MKNNHRAQSLERQVEAFFPETAERTRAKPIHAPPLWRKLLLQRRKLVYPPSSRPFTPFTEALYAVHSRSNLCSQGAFSVAYGSAQVIYIYKYAKLFQDTDGSVVMRNAKNMNDFIAKNTSAKRGIDECTTEEEVMEFILSTLKEISFMACSIRMPPERRERIAGSIALLERCVGLYSRKPIWRDAANCH